MSSTSAEVGALGIRKDAKNMFTKGKSMWKKTKFKLCAINEFSGAGADQQLCAETSNESKASEISVVGGDNTGKEPPRPVVLQRSMTNAGFCHMSTGQFGASRANLFDASTVVPSAAEQHGHIDPSIPDSPTKENKPSSWSGNSPPVALSRALSQSAFGSSRANLFDPNSVVPSASEQMGIMPANESASGVKRPRTGDVPVVLQRHMSQSRFGASRANLFDASSVIPSAVDQMGLHDVVDADTLSRDAVATKPVSKPTKLQKSMSHSAFGASRANLFDVNSVIPSAADQMGVVGNATHALPPERKGSQNSGIVSSISNTSTTSSISKPIKLQKTMSQSAFGASRANLFDASSIIPSAAEQMGVVVNSTHALPPERKGSQSSGIVSSHSNTSTTSSISKPVKLQKSMSQSAFGASRANLFDATSIIPSAADQMGVVVNSTHALPPERKGSQSSGIVSSHSNTSTTSSISKPVKLQKSMSQSAFGASRANLFDATSIIPSAADQMGVIANNTSALPPSSSAKKTSSGSTLSKPIAMEKQLSKSHFGASRANLFDPASCMPSASEQMGLSAPIAQPSIAAASSNASQPVGLRREMSKSAFGMSRSNLFDPCSAMASASEQMGLATPNEAVAKRAGANKHRTPQSGPIARAQSVSVFLELGTDDPSQDMLAHSMSAGVKDENDIMHIGEEQVTEDDPFGSPPPGFDRQESVSQMLISFDPTRRTVPVPVEQGSSSVASLEEDGTEHDIFGSPGFDRQESVSQMLLDFTPTQQKYKKDQIVPGSFDDDDDPFASGQVNRGFDRQESVSQMLLDFTPTKQQQQQQRAEQVVPGSFDDDDDPFASGQVNRGFDRQESVSQMLLDFTPTKQQQQQQRAEQVVPGSFDDDDDDDDPFASGEKNRGFDRQESVSQMLLDFTPTKQQQQKQRVEQVVPGSFDEDDDDDDDPFASGQVNRGFDRQESVSQMLLDFTPTKQQQQQGAEQVVPGSFDDDDDDPFASGQVNRGFDRQESVSQMLLDFTPTNKIESNSATKQKNGHHCNEPTSVSFVPASPGYERQESVAQMLLDFTPGKPVSEQPPVVAGSLSDDDDDGSDDNGDDDDPFAPPSSSKGFQRQESVSQMLLEMEPKVSRTRKTAPVTEEEGEKSQTNAGSATSETSSSHRQPAFISSEAAVQVSLTGTVDHAAHHQDAWSQTSQRQLLPAKSPKKKANHEAKSSSARHLNTEKQRQQQQQSSCGGIGRPIQDSSVLTKTEGLSLKLAQQKTEGELPSIAGTSVVSPTGSGPRDIIFGASTDIAQSRESRMAMMQAGYEGSRAMNDRFIPAVLRRQLGPQQNKAQAAARTPSKRRVRFADRANSPALDDDQDESLVVYADQNQNQAALPRSSFARQANPALRGLASASPMSSLRQAFEEQSTRITQLQRELHAERLRSEQLEADLEAAEQKGERHRQETQAQAAELGQVQRGLVQAQEEKSSLADRFDDMQKRAVSLQSSLWQVKDERKKDKIDMTRKYERDNALLKHHTELGALFDAAQGSSDTTLCTCWCRKCSGPGKGQDRGQSQWEP
ncbi:Hypothetical Protein FCC1311_063182 [Hondaea fermentalgiana]|uniref:Uncharacterized protein n=1 Tax=Hondaea fermentalgiana TaxID=2315210 RepID=A0A2R5GK47_9STRA|nr:Hypothetical Protein FCC1311_063182 [Hondaea fermentalgiana]|eukprot:GBG30098.1 Hypothetical Protein FCC1311_063182 [Hondaea fermentalgiana]